MKKFLLTTVALLILGVGVYYYQKQSSKFPNHSSVTIQEGVKSPTTSEGESGPDIEIVAENLEIPWEVAFLPNGEFLVTERPGRLLKIGSDRKIYEIEGVRHVGEGGLLGMVLHPNFATNNYVYLYITSSSGKEIVNRVERYRFENDSLSDREIILDGIEGAPNHDGGRLEFGPDGFLYITTGDAQVPSLSQDTNSLNGKILRVDENGAVPKDNPFGNEVYSYGHRNVQGLAWDEDGNLWATEHGRSGVLSGLDELNLIEKGRNYGWPTIQGDQEREGMETPAIHSGASETWAPAGAEYLKSPPNNTSGSIFFAGLRGSTLYEVVFDGTEITTLRKHFSKEYGRLRAVRLGPDGYLYITTSNRDGRGNVRNGDDKLIRVHPRVFRE